MNEDAMQARIDALEAQLANEVERREHWTAQSRELEEGNRFLYAMVEGLEAENARLAEAADRITSLEAQIGECQAAHETGQRAIERNAQLEAQLAEREKEASDLLDEKIDLQAERNAIYMDRARLSDQIAKARESFGAIEIGLSDGMHFTLLRMVREALADLPATSAEPLTPVEWEILNKTTVIGPIALYKPEPTDEQVSAWARKLEARVAKLRAEPVVRDGTPTPEIVAWAEQVHAEWDAEPKPSSEEVERVIGELRLIADAFEGRQSDNLSSTSRTAREAIAILLCLSAETKGDGLGRCAICGFVVDLSYEHEKPTIDFATAGRHKHKSAKGGVK